MNANTMTFYVEAPLKQVRRVIEVIQKRQPEAEIQTRKVDIVSAIGANIKSPTLIADATAALRDHDIELLAVHAPARSVDVQFVLADGGYDDAVRVLHTALVEKNRNGHTLAA